MELLGAVERGENGGTGRRACSGLPPFTSVNLRQDRFPAVADGWGVITPLDARVQASARRKITGQVKFQIKIYTSRLAAFKRESGVQIGDDPRNLVGSLGASIRAQQE